MLTLRDYFMIILALPHPAYVHLIERFELGLVKNEKTIQALKIIQGLPLDD